MMNPEVFRRLYAANSPAAASTAGPRPAAGVRDVTVALDGTLPDLTWLRQQPIEYDRRYDDFVDRAVHDLHTDTVFSRNALMQYLLSAAKHKSFADSLPPEPEDAPPGQALSRGGLRSALWNNDRVTPLGTTGHENMYYLAPREPEKNEPIITKVEAFMSQAVRTYVQLSELPTGRGVPTRELRIATWAPKLNGAQRDLFWRVFEGHPRTIARENKVLYIHPESVMQPPATVGESLELIIRSCMIGSTAMSRESAFSALLARAFGGHMILPASSNQILQAMHLDTRFEQSGQKSSTSDPESRFRLRLSEVYRVMQESKDASGPLPADSDNEKVLELKRLGGQIVDHLIRDGAKSIHGTRLLQIIADHNGGVQLSEQELQTFFSVTPALRKQHADDAAEDTFFTLHISDRS